MSYTHNTYFTYTLWVWHPYALPVLGQSPTRLSSQLITP